MFRSLGWPRFVFHICFYRINLSLEIFTQQSYYRFKSIGCVTVWFGRNRTIFRCFFLSSVENPNGMLDLKSQWFHFDIKPFEHMTSQKKMCRKLQRNQYTYKLTHINYHSRLKTIFSRSIVIHQGFFFLLSLCLVFDRDRKLVRIVCIVYSP